MGELSKKKQYLAIDLKDERKLVVFGVGGDVHRGLQVRTPGRTETLRSLGESWGFCRGQLRAGLNFVRFSVVRLDTGLQCHHF